MSQVTPSALGPSVFDRARNILVRPKVEWPIIAAEPASIGSIYRDYVVYLAAIPVLCTFLAALVFGEGAFGITSRPPFFAALWSAAVQYVLLLAGAYVLALIINLLAPRFGGADDSLSAFKLAAYSATASWAAGVFNLVPALSFLTILGLYSLYLLYTGAPVLMRIPADRALSFSAAIIGVGIVLSLLVAALLAAFASTENSTAMAPPDEAGRLGSGMATLEAARKHAEAIQQQMEAAQGRDQDSKAEEPEIGSVQPVAADALKAVLPETLPGGFAKTEGSTSTVGAAGFGFAVARADYQRGDAKISISLTDLGAAGAIAALGAAFGANTTEETETSYSKTYVTDGRMVTEAFNRQTEQGSYGMIVGNRIMVNAEGYGADMEELKSAIAAIDLDRVESLLQQ